MATLQEAIAMRDEALAAGDTERAAKIEQRIQDAGLEIPERSAPAAPEPSFLDNWGRVIGEAGGSLVGGALGLPGGIPGVMAGAALGGHAGGMGWDYLTGSDAPPPEQQVLSAGLNTMGGPSIVPAKAPSMLAGLVPEGRLFDVGTAGAAAAADQPISQAASDAVYRRGGSLTPGQRGGKFGKRLEGPLESSQFAGPTMERQREQVVDIFGDIIEEQTPFAASRDVAGEAAVTGFEQQATRANEVVDHMYRAFDDALERGGGGRLSRVSAEALQNLSQEYKTLAQRDPGFAEMVFQDPDLYRAINSIDEMIAAGERPTYDILKRLRTMIGKKIDFHSPGSEQTGLKRLYQTLTDDLDEGAREIGGEAAYKAGKNADAAFAQLQSELKALDPVFRNAENPTQVYQALNRALINNPKLAEAARSAMGPDAWDMFRDTWLRQATRATKAGQDLTGTKASPHTAASALAELKKQSPEGYRMLVEGSEEAIRIIDELANRLRESEQFINRSRTGATVQGGLFGGDIIGAATLGGASLLTGQGPTIPMAATAVGLVTRPILSKMTAKALTSPTFNRALEKVGRTYASHAGGLPRGQDLIRALISAGADRSEVEEIFGVDYESE